MVILFEFLLTKINLIDIIYFSWWSQMGEKKKFTC